MKVQGCLRIIFDGAFYKAIFETQDCDKYLVAQVNLGASVPKLTSLLKLVNHNFANLDFYPIDNSVNFKQKKINPKRVQRLASKEMKKTQLSTKAQLTLKQQFEVKKIAAKKQSASELELVKASKFKLKQAKRKEKHRGH